MKKFFVLLVLTLLQAHLFSQTLPKKLNQANWQQKVDYTIQVALDDSMHTLSAFERITYSNNSPDKITDIYMHLWPNAYKTRTTAYAKQELENGNTNFHYADESERGYIDSLDFKVNGQKVNWEFTQDIDVAILHLANPLNPGEKLEITTPFKVKLPAVFSRMGYEEGVYCVTQWYPKPAVYDVNGWNPMPYLNQGEFYSEFGKFDVSITLPKNILVAATGQVQDPSEKEWWLERKKSATANHPAVGDLKTVRFLQDSVHDFAWFASEKFMASNSEVTLSNGQVVETWIFAKAKNEKSKVTGIESVNEGVTFYSEKVGNYPYSIAQVVITPLKAGGGMEYPTITNCASNDKTTIVHEVGHNWFYGILASNEREYPWMDESFNTYYENRNANDKKGMVEPGQTFSINKIFSGLDQTKMLFNYSSRNNIDQPGNLHSDRYTDNNYGAIIYAKNPIGFGYLQAYLGTEKFDAMMQAYFEKWKFKHPLPNDFKEHAESFTQQNLSWFFEGVLGSTQKQDYKMVTATSESVTIKNNGNLVAPLAVSILNEDSILHTVWFEGFAGTKTFNMPKYPYTEDALIYRIDANKKTLDLYRQNNSKVVKGDCPTCSKIKLQPLGNLENENSNQVFWSPVYAFNVYNKSMLGLAFYNSLFPQKKNEYIIMPVYSFEKSTLNGYASYWHNFYTDGKIRNLQVGFNAARFASQGVFYNSGTSDTTVQKVLQNGGAYYGNIYYEKFAPFVKINLQPNNRRSNKETSIKLTYFMINEQAEDRSILYNFGSNHVGIGELKYEYADRNVLFPRTASVALQSGIQNVSFNKLSAEFKQRFLYKKGKAKSAEIRLFAGGFLFEQTDVLGSRDMNFSQRAAFQAGGNSGTNDYLYQEAMMGRMEQLGNINPPNPGNTKTQNRYGRQVLYTQSGFRNFASVGSTNSFLSAMNITIPAPIPVPIGVYADLSYWQAPAGYITVVGVAGVTTTYYPAQMKTTYNAGVYLNVSKDVLNIYLPLVYSDDVNAYWQTMGYTSFFSRISFVFNLNKLNPIKAIRDIKL